MKVLRTFSTARSLAVTLALLFIAAIIGCGGGGGTTGSNTLTNPPVTNPPVTNPPVTNPPVTNPPVTNPPANNPPDDNRIIGTWKLTLIRGADGKSIHCPGGDTLDGKFASCAASELTTFNADGSGIDAHGSTIHYDLHNTLLKERVPGINGVVAGYITIADPTVQVPQTLLAWSPIYPDGSGTYVYLYVKQ